MRGIVRGAAHEVSFLKVEVLLLADAAKLRVLRVEIFEADSEGLLVPAADDKHTVRASAVEHLSEAFFSNAFRQDPEGVHAHAAQSEGSCFPELVVG